MKILADLGVGIYQVVLLVASPILHTSDDYTHVETMQGMFDKSVTFHWFSTVSTIARPLYWKGVAYLMLISCK